MATMFDVTANQPFLDLNLEQIIIIMCNLFEQDVSYGVVKDVHILNLDNIVWLAYIICL